MEVKHFSPPLGRTVVRVFRTPHSKIPPLVSPLLFPPLSDPFPDPNTGELKSKVYTEAKQKNDIGFDTADAAAKAALGYINPISISQNKEYAGWIYKDKERGQSRNLVINHKDVVNKGRSGTVVVRLNRSKVGDEKKNTRLRD